MNNNKTIIDVRTPAEFAGGNVTNSINIPLNEIETRLAEIKQMQQPITLCCASGIRSGQATAYLRNIGINCENGGSWIDVNNSITNN
ncbi:MAG: rhodanese-like domain-containing protein [Bacteroidetes bacterium]|nr:rhodanese-like domain-containing protein [Bacteroidota bacterium]MBS1649174.1 rhodanese-like domain-containing protein [Bacteroidota bacterium]